MYQDYSRKNRAKIRIYWTPSGDAQIHDEILGTSYWVWWHDMHMLGENPVENIVHRMFSRRYYIVEDYVHQIVWRQSILGEYAERYGCLIRSLRESTPGLDDSPIYTYSLLFDRPDRARYYGMDFTESARMVYDNGETPYTEYMMRAQLKGVDYYTEEEFAFVKSAFEAFKHSTTNYKE